jgi:hypothetical protein
MAEAHENLKLQALILANAHPADPAKIVERANVYHGFLSGAAKAAATQSAATPAAATTTVVKADPKTTATKAEPKADPKAAKAAADAKAKAAAEAKAKAAAAAAAKPATTPSGGPASDDGLVMEDVSKALQGLLAKGIDPKADQKSAPVVAIRNANKVVAYKILEEIGKAKAVRDIKPSLYKAVIDACKAALAAPAAEAAPAEAATDDFGTPISADDNAVDTDPPEQVEGGAGADGEDL